ncbi:unnamed protein product [Mytilus coruscus]|uniref:Uncharacterized protein n=1 Tax=Mytilus coruscus TaxID=42192 RepID=A0A6J8EKM1_MYTCO|nr:unnamed protein product [Mytilus coruscus]
MELDQHYYDVYKVIIFWKPSDYQESLVDDCEENRGDLERQEAARRDWHPGGCARAREDEQPIGRTQDTTKEPKRTTCTNNGCTCFCWKVCKNARDLKIHQSRMKCVPPHSGNQRTERSSQTEEETIQEANHSDDNLHLRKDTREKLKTLTRAETHKGDRKKRAKERAQFTAHPFQYMKRLFGAKGSGKFGNSKEEVEKHLRKTNSDERIKVQRSAGCSEESKSIISTRAKWYSISGIQDLTQADQRLWKLLAVVWRRRKMIDAWYKAEGCFIPKEENSRKVEQFRIISLLNIEGKIFLAVLAKRTTRSLLSNEYIDLSVQKGGMPETMLQEYFDHIEMRFTVGDFTTAWQRLEIGILTGFIVSVVLFAAAMNLIVKSVEKPSRGPLMSSGIRQPPVRAFMDDMNVTAQTVIEG